MAWPCSGVDFGSLEYAQALVPVLPQLTSAALAILAKALGKEHARLQFCTFAAFPPNRARVTPEPQLHRTLGP